MFGTMLIAQPEMTLKTQRISTNLCNNIGIDECMSKAKQYLSGDILLWLKRERKICVGEVKT
jgi:hypothetical protein